MENSQIYEFPIKEWEILPLEVYEKVLQEQKENFSMYISETQSITDKSIRLLIGFGTFSAAAGGYIFNKHAHSCLNIILGIMSVISIIGLYYIFKGHLIHYNGTKPDEILTKNFDDKNYSIEDKKRLVYLNIIKQYGFKVNEMSFLNAKRVILYDIFLIYTILVIIIIACYVGAI